MKGTVTVLFAGIIFFYSFVYPEPAFGQRVEADGSVEGIIVLAAKENPVRVGGRYGRPSRSASTTGASSDSVLVLLESANTSASQSNNTPVILDQKDLAFKPSLLAVRQHKSVRILNSDPVYHNVFSLSPVKRFDVGRRPKGEYLDVTFDKPGVVDVFCDIHSNMRATIYVIPPNVLKWMKVKSGEEFNIENIDPGNYHLKIYALGYQEQSIPIEITPDESTNVGTLILNF